MALLNVIKYGHPVLRQVAEKYEPGEISQNFVDDMIETMKAKDGVGLAAPQVGVSKRFIVVMDMDKIFTLVNPEIIGYSEFTVPEVEGCLSIPGVQGEVIRPEKVVVKALDIDGTQLEIKTGGLLARVFQHEIDHLNGIVYLDRADPSTLEWLEGKDARSREITLPEIQENFKQLYHQGREKLAYEPKVEIKTV